MKGILSHAGRKVLAQFAWSNVLVAFDYDGTLSPIVADRDRASIRLRTRERLEQLSTRYPVIVISGRGLADVRTRLSGTGVCHVVGNHGIEPWQATRPVMDEVTRWQPILKDRLASLRGVEIEDKSFSVAVHYRQSRAKKIARAAILAAAAELGHVRVITGKQVMNILPHGAPHKGLALERERDRLGCDTAIYVGDDETDEDVFALDQPGRLLTVRVGAKSTSMANYCIRTQRDIDGLIQALLDLRPASQQRKTGQI
jgi:trehalose 6-phosphate phosphatase